MPRSGLSPVDCIPLWPQIESDSRSPHYGKERNARTNLRCHFLGRFRDSTFYIWRIRGYSGACVYAGAAVLGILWAISLLVEMLARPAATMLGVMFFLFVVLLHIPRIVGNSRNQNEWTSGFVALAMCGGAWILASAAPLEEREKADPFLRLGRYFFALAFVAFGIQHFVYAHIAAGVGPPWIPGRPLSAYLFGVIFVGAGVAIFIGKKTRMAATLLGTITFLYFLLLYAPRIEAQLHNPGPWTSGFEILALCGFASVLANTFPKEEKG